MGSRWNLELQPMIARMRSCELDTTRKAGPGAAMPSAATAPPKGLAAATRRRRAIVVAEGGVDIVDLERHVARAVGRRLRAA
jgi:hypothetical protein